MECGVPFCQSGEMIAGMTSGCPLNNLIPEGNDLIRAGNWEQAYERLAKNHSFPEFTSYVCPALCEKACTCNINEEPVAIRANEKEIIETAFANGWVEPKEVKLRTGKSVAIIGSGPAGLAAAQMLNEKGHNVTVFERSDRNGGLLCYGIPNMKLDKEIIERRIKILEAEGVIFKNNVNVGKDIEASQIIADFDRVILACGASNPRDVKAKGRDAGNIYFAVDYLKSVTKSLLDSDLKDKKFIPTKGKHVLVIGGGDTGNDCVATATWLKAASVTQLEMMAKPPLTRAASNPWPEWPLVLKTDYGQEAAIKAFGHDPRIFETTVHEFIKDKKGNVKSVKTKKGEMPVDLVLIAAGFLGSESYITKAFGVEQDERSNVKTNLDEYETNVPKVFVAGDMRRGQSLVAWAIAEGRAVAKVVDKSLMGYTL